MKKLLLLTLPLFLLAACGTQNGVARPGMGMGGPGMMSRHHADLPAEYAGLTNPVPPDDASLGRGAELYAVNCASCHGAGGLGDGPAGAALDPPPAAVAHTSQMMADDYLFWRISEGGAPFSTSMPPWKVLPEQSRWDLVNYMRALGAGGVSTDPAVAMLAQAVEQGVVTQAEADLFNAVHNAMEQYRVGHPEIANRGASATEREALVLSALVEEKTITRAQADAFQEIHDRLGASGLMP